MAAGNEDATATDPATPTVPSDPAGEPQREIGRYRIERLLGTGGMGVVYCAFDPELERRVALKVLPGSRRSQAAVRERLLHEARAMARLNHPNVIKVFEVGTAGDHDYVAMELVEGANLAEWLRAEQHTPREIVNAFLDAGRGLAAAHAVGLIHRDFKPHNVLRSSDGAIAVTDFGLARDVGEATPAPADRNTPSPLGGLTETGSILGTPAYMAPEQWQGDPVGPAADQFAFCVALWEALSGARPFRGEVHEMRAAVLRGPAALDATAIPRPLRDVLRRGLEPDPARRWPDITALLRRLSRFTTRSGLVFALAGASATALAAIAILALRPASDHCSAPRLDPDAVWSAPAISALVATHQLRGLHRIGEDVTTWKLARAGACKAEPAKREPELACLDSVMARIAGVLDVVGRVHLPQLPISEQLLDPAICERPSPPRLAPTMSPQYRAVLERELGEEANPEHFTRPVADRLIAGAVSDPCAASFAVLYSQMVETSAPGRRLGLARASDLAERCNDDYMRFRVALHAARDEFLDPNGDAARRAVERLELAVAPVAQADTLADVAYVKAFLAGALTHFDVTITQATSAMAGFLARGRIGDYVDAAALAYAARLARTNAEDLDALPRMLATMRAAVTDALGPGSAELDTMDDLDASWRFEHGDLAGAHALYDRPRRQLPLSETLRVTGRLVDPHGDPVAGATVTTGTHLIGDSLEAAVGDPSAAPAMRRTVTDRDGNFVLPASAPLGTIIAELGERRSHAAAIAAHVDLVLDDTGTIDGTIELAGTPAFRVSVAVWATEANAPDYRMYAPVNSDGTFRMTGIPRGRVMVSVHHERGPTVAATQQVVDVGSAPSHVAFRLPAEQRTISVLVRSTVGQPVPRAIVFALQGVVTVHDLRDLMSLSATLQSIQAAPISEAAPAAVRAQARSGDLLSTIRVSPTTASTCVVGYPAVTSDLTEDKLRAHEDLVPVSCIEVPQDRDVVVVEVPPFPRLD
jgi:predicted Ser/Thr protein kinase